MRTMPRLVPFPAFLLLLGLTGHTVVQSGSKDGVSRLIDRGLALEKKGDIQAAADVYQQALRRANASFGTNDPRTANVLSLLGNAQRRLS